MLGEIFYARQTRSPFSAENVVACSWVSVSLSSHSSFCRCSNHMHETYSICSLTRNNRSRSPVCSRMLILSLHWKGWTPQARFLLRCAPVQAYVRPLPSMQRSSSSAQSISALLVPVAVEPWCVCMGVGGI